MGDPVVRPSNGLLLFALQSAEGTYATPSPLTDVVPCEVSSVTYNGPYANEDTDEANGSFAAGAPLIVGQPATFSFRARIKGAGPGVTYTASVKPPLHAALSACGWLGVFQAALVAAALTAGTTTSGTLGAAAAATAQIYRGMPLVLVGSPAAGRRPLVADYSAGKVATLTDQYGTPLTTTNTAAIPANWTYAPTTPIDSASRASMHPAGTLFWYEDGTLYQYGDMRGTIDFDGDTARPGFATFSFTGVFISKTDVTMPINAVYPAHSAPMLVQGAGTGPIAQINRRGLPISKWSLKNGGTIQSPTDPNTPIGFGAGQIAGRKHQLEVDPLSTLVATRNILADIAAFSQYNAALQFGAVAGNSWSLMMPLIQPVTVTPAMREQLRAETQLYQAINPGKDNSNRDGDAVLCFA